MKTLYVHRHAKAVKEGYEHDFSRSLRATGLEDAHQMGRYLKHRHFSSDLILTSPAERAVQTARLIAEHTGEKLLVEDRLYGGGWRSILQVLQEQEAILKAVRIVGHNPDLEDLCGILCGIRNRGIHLATCGVVCISCDIDDWSDLDRDMGLLEWSIRPIHM